MLNQNAPEYYRAWRAVGLFLLVGGVIFTMYLSSRETPDSERRAAISACKVGSSINGCLELLDPPLTGRDDGQALQVGIWKGTDDSERRVLHATADIAVIHNGGTIVEVINLSKPEGKVRFEQAFQFEMDDH